MVSVEAATEDSQQHSRGAALCAGAAVCWVGPMLLLSNFWGSGFNIRGLIYTKHMHCYR